MTLLDEGIALRDAYLSEHGLDIQDFSLGLQQPPFPYTNWAFYNEYKFAPKLAYNRWGFFLIYLNPRGEPYLLNDLIPYGVLRFLGYASKVPKDVKPPKVISQLGRKSEIHFEPIRDGRSWESLPEGTPVIHCESLIKAKLIHKATGIPCIGYNGVYGWSLNIADVPSGLAHAACGLDFSRFHNIILFDSDVHTNTNVIRARFTLSSKLRHKLNCSLISWANLPQHKLEDGTLINWGPDDFLLTMGLEALLEVIKNAEPFRNDDHPDLIEEMNKEVRFVLCNSSIYVRKRRTNISVNNARNEFMNINKEIMAGKTKKTVFGIDVWLKSKAREEVDAVEYRYLGEEFYYIGERLIANSYTKGGFEPGPTSLNHEDIILRTLEKFCSPPNLELLRSWIKFLKFGGRKPTSYPVLWSTPRGVGKGWFTRLVSALIGNQHVVPYTADLLAEKFNKGLTASRLVVFDEFKASSRESKTAATNAIKNFIADETIAVRGMYENSSQADIRAGIIITVNDKTAVPSDGLEDRRQWYVECFKTWSTSEEWDLAWEALKDPEQMSRFSRWAYEGEDRDFSSWRPPMTDERAQDLMTGQDAIIQAAYDVRMDMLELGIRVIDLPTIKYLVGKQMGWEGGVQTNDRAFAEHLKKAQWTSPKEFARITPSKAAGWFPKEPVWETYMIDKIHWARQWLNEDKAKVIIEKKKY